VLNPFVFFLPELSYYPYARILSVYADCLQRQGFPVFFLTCKGGLDSCIYRIRLASEGKEPSDRNMAQYCASCRRHQKLLHQRYNFEYIYIEDILGHDGKQMAEDIVAQCADLKNCQFKGVNVGQQAQYDLILMYKDGELRLTPPKEHMLRRQLRANIKISMAASNLMAKYAVRGFACTQNYNAQAALRNACIPENVQVFQIEIPLFLGYGGDRNYITKDLLLHFRSVMLKHWEQVEGLPIPEEAVQDNFSDVYFRNYGSNAHLFSPNKGNDPGELLGTLGLDKNKKILVAYTSSTDEIAATQNMYASMGYSFPFQHLFATQEEWILRTAAYAEQKGYQLVVRMHPRMGQTASLARESPQLADFRKALADIPASCTVIWPEDSVSSYDLAELADVVLSSWSTMSQELSRIGIPCIAVSKTYAYSNTEFICCPDSVEEYLLQIDASVNGGYTFETFKKAIRFFNYTQSLMVYKIPHGVSHQFPPTIYHDRPTPRIPDAALSDLKQIFLGQSTPFDQNFAKLTQYQNTESSAAKEAGAIFEGIGHFLESTYAPRSAVGASHQIKQNLKRWLKKNLPKSLVSLIKNARSLKHAFLPGEFERDVHIPLWDARTLLVSTDEGKTESFQQATAQDSSLRILLVTGAQGTVYFMHGMALPRTSRLIVRLGLLLLENYPHKVVAPQDIC